MGVRIQKQIEDQVAGAAAGHGKIDQREFDRIFGTIKRAVNGKKNDREVKKLMVQVMEATGHNKVKTGWFTDWYAALKKDLGV